MLYMTNTQTQKKQKELNKALILACSQGNLEEVKELLKQGIDINQLNTMHLSGLSYACTYNHTNVIAFLLENGANPNLGTPLSESCRRGNLEAVNLLLDNGALITDEAFVAMYNRHENIALRLIDGNIDLTVKSGSHKDTLLHYACAFGEVKIVRALLEKGADVNVKNNLDDTPLFYACNKQAYLKVTEQDRLEIAKMLIERGADVNASNLWNKRPIHEACEDGYLEIVKFLIQRGSKTQTCSKISTPSVKKFLAQYHRDNIAQ